MRLQNQHPARLMLQKWHLWPYLLMLAVFCYGLTFAFPQTDDYCTFGRLQSNSGGNPLREALYLYNNWTGRYSASFATAVVGWLHSLVPVSLQSIYASYLIAALGVFVASAYFVSKTLTREKSGTLALALLIAVSSLLLMPSRLEGVFWVTGLAVYTLGIFAILLLYFFATRDCVLNEAGRARISWATICLIAICVGFNEFIGLCVGVFLAVRVLTATHARVYLRQNVVYFAVYAMTFSAAILAPGNFARDSTISANRHDLGAALQLSWASFSDFYAMHLSPEMYLLAMIALAALAIGVLMSASFERVSLKYFLPIVASLLASLPIHLFVYTFLIGDKPPGRVVNEFYVMLIVAICLVMAWCGMAIGRRMTSPALRRLAPVAVFVAGIVLASSTDFRQLVVSTRDFAPLWKKQQEQRERLIAAAVPNTPLLLPAFTREPTDPPIFQGADISGDSTYWVNRCVADFNRVGEIKLQEAK